MFFYRALLLLYPASFRAEYAGELSAIFKLRRRDAAGFMALTALWIDVLIDTVLTAGQAHWDILRQDLHYTARTLRKSPGFALTAVAVVALGIGANTAIFSITDHVLLRPLPFRDANRLVDLWEDQSFRGYSRNDPSPANYRDWKRLSSSFEMMAATRSFGANLQAGDSPEHLEGTAVTAELFPMLGIQPLLGRVFNEEDDRSGAPGTVILSYGLWAERFGSDSSIVGRNISLDGAAFTVIGVMPRDFTYPRRDVAFWAAMRFDPSDFEDRNNSYLRVIGKLRRGVTLDAARAELKVVAAQLGRQFPVENGQLGVTVIRLREELPARSRTMFIALSAGAVCILLIACANLANLLLARSLVRRKELAIRAALGAGRERLVRQLLTESMVVAIAGGLLGVALAYGMLPVLAYLVPASLPVAAAPVLDMRVLAFAILATIATGLAFGLAPVLRLGGANLREGGRDGVGGRREGLRSALVIAEVTASVVLLIISGLLVRALMKLQATDTGFQSQGVLTVRTALPMPKYGATVAREKFYSRVLSDIRALPGVTAAGYTSYLPIVFRGGIQPVTIQGRPKEKADKDMASMRFVTPGYFAAMGIPVREGRDVSEADTLASTPVAVVSESFARDYWAAQNALGRRFGFSEGTRMVVGVVGDIRVRGLEQRSEPQVYLPYKQVPDNAFTWFAPKDLAIRTTIEPLALVPQVRRIVARADPTQPISDVQPLAAIVDSETSPRRVQLWLLGTFAGLAFVLAAIGIHGLLSFTVTHRAQEIGVRIALGAQSFDILRIVLGEGALLGIAGIAAGSLGGYAAGKMIESLLAGVAPADALTFTLAVALCLMMTLAGSLVPAVRAMRVDPVAVMRAE
jgi:predicted permease